MSKHKHRHEPREMKRQQFVAPPARSVGPISWNALIIFAGLALLSTIVYVVGTRAGGTAAVVAGVGVTGGDLALPASTFDDGQARFYRYPASTGREIRFFVMKSSDGVIRAAFDSCDVCYRERKGYRQSGDVMICNNCGKAFRSADINVLQGGCNPAPLERAVQGGQVVLKAAALELGAAYF